MEHYTAVLVESMMTHVHKPMTDESIRNLWLWHSIEETEHKAVAFDLYESIYGKGLSAYLPRVAVYTLSVCLAHGNDLCLYRCAHETRQTAVQCEVMDQIG